MRCQWVVTGRTFSTSSIQREVIHAHGHTGSNQKSTFVRSSFITQPYRGAGRGGPAVRPSVMERPGWCRCGGRPGPRQDEVQLVSGVDIRTARTEDRDAIAALVRAAFSADGHAGDDE